MFKEIFLFELRYRLRRPATWLYFGMLFLMAFLLMIGAGGAFGDGSKVSLGGGGPLTKINSPYSLMALLVVMSAFGVIIVSALMGNPVYRDFEHRTHSLFYTTPISKWGYLGGRFLGSYAIAVLVFSGLMWGAWAGTLWPTIPADRLADFRLASYLWPFGVFVLANLFFTGAIFFSLATLTRNILSTYIGSMLLLIVYLGASNSLQDLDNKTLAMLLDPYGLTAAFQTARYWTPADQNARLLPLTDVVLLNRALWLGAGLLLLGACYVRFRFSAFASEKVSKKARKAAAEAEAIDAAQRPGLGTALLLPRVAQVFSTANYLRQWWSLVKTEYRGVVRSVYFKAIVGAGLIFLVWQGAQIGKMYDTTVYPSTAIIARGLGGAFALFVLIIITYYSGELVWREREARTDGIADALPVPTWVPFLAKLTALMLVVTVLQAVVGVGGVLTQALRGYFQFEPLLYVKMLFLVQLPFYLLLVVLAVLVQAIVPNKFVGHFVMVAYYLLDIFRDQLGLSHNLLNYGGADTIRYSDMNGFGHFLAGFTWFKLYSAGFALLLAVAASLLWVRGTGGNFRGRLREGRRRLSLASLGWVGLGLVLILGCGSFIFYNTNVRNRYTTPAEQERAQVSYEQKFRRYRLLPQPRVVAVDLAIDLYPQRRAAHVVGQQWLRNRHARPLDTLYLNLNPRAQVRQLTFRRAGQAAPAQLLLQDSTSTDVTVRLYRLARPLAPGDSLQLHLVADYRELGFPNSGSNTEIVYNGTFFNNFYLPVLGYNEQGELSSDQDRKRHQLPVRPRVARRAEDAPERANAYISQDADQIRFQATVSTDPDQIALAPGTLQKEWTQNGRRYFRYVPPRTIVNFYSILSGRYQVHREQWVDSAGRRTVPIEIYYHPGHEYNLKRIAAGAREALAYCSQHFSPYQYDQVRFVEFPRYASFAQSFAGTIPFSEGIGFVAKVDDANPEDVDYPFYVAAHEVAHQWWGHQVCGAPVQGGSVMVESMAQYSALMTMKHHYGPQNMEKFLRYEADRYLGGRAFEDKKEVPLALVEQQQYIHYQKGSQVMYAMQDYLGENRFNQGLRDFIQQWAFKGPPYPTTLDFLASIRRVTPDSLQPFVTDNFDRITLYDNKVDGATATKLPNGQYKLRLTVDAKKFYADSLGDEKPAALRGQDYVVLAVFPESKQKTGVKPLLLAKRPVRSGHNTYELVVPGKPARAAVDPYHELVDRNLDDNSKEVKL